MAVQGLGQLNVRKTSSMVKETTLHRCEMPRSKCGLTGQFVRARTN